MHEPNSLILWRVGPFGILLPLHAAGAQGTERRGAADVAAQEGPRAGAKTKYRRKGRQINSSMRLVGPTSELRVKLAQRVAQHV